jgi:hypothetical protein
MFVLLLRSFDHWLLSASGRSDAVTAISDRYLYIAFGLQQLVMEYILWHSLLANVMYTQ